MRLLFVISCIFAFLARDIARTSWEIWFKVNQDRIAAEKCENKDIPMMHCNGKCYLAKKLEKLEEKEQNHNSKTNPFGQSAKADWISDQQLTVDGLHFINFEEESAACPAYRSGEVRDFHHAVFHPPAAA